jgi:hypothetical protein
VTYKLGSMPSDVNDGVQETFSPAWVDQKAVVTFAQKVSGLSPGPISVHARIFWAQDEDGSNDAALITMCWWKSKRCMASRPSTR